MTKKTISIIGLGAAGASVFVQLIEELSKKKVTHKNLFINLFEKSTSLAKGIAYSSDSESSLLNSTVERTSIFADNPLHFFEWIKKNRTLIRKEFPNLKTISKSAYVPRKLCGLYLKSTFDQYQKLAKKLKIQVNLFQEEVINIVEDHQKSCIITPKSKYESQTIILCTGHIYANPYPAFNSETNFIPVPYPESNFLNKITKNSRTLILGSRLTAIDVAIALLERGHQNISICSRSNLMPMPTTPQKPYTPKHMGTENIHLDFTIEEMINRIKKEFFCLYGNNAAIKKLFDKNISQKDFISEVEKTRLGKSYWQLTASFFDNYIESCWKHLNKQGKKSFINEWNSRLKIFTATLPLETAEKVAGYFKSGKLKLILHANKLKKTNGNCFMDKQGNEFDYVINASGYIQNLAKETLYENLIKQRKITLNSAGGLNVRLETMEIQNHHFKFLKLYALGPPIFGSKIIVDFLLFIAADAKKLINDYTSLSST